MQKIEIETTNKPKPRPPEDKLGFGKFFSDHMFVAKFSLAKGWHEPKVMPYQSFEVDPAAAVLHYGQAIFEGMKAYQGVDGKIRLFRPERNWNRMRLSADRLCMNFIDEDLFLNGLMELVRADQSWIPSKAGTSLYLRPTLIATEPFLGVRPAQEYIFYVIASPVGAYYGETIAPVKIWVERNYSRAALGGIGATKAGGNYAASLKASVAAVNRGFAQVLWLDAAEKKYVEEVGTMNVFFVIGDRLITPSLGGTILPGVTRDSVIELANHWGRTVEERQISLDEVIAAHSSGDLKEIFGTGTAASITPVSALGIDDQLLTINHGQVGPFSSKLYKYLTGLQYGEIDDPRGWTVEIPLIGTISSHKSTRDSLSQTPHVRS